MEGEVWRVRCRGCGVEGVVRRVSCGLLTRVYNEERVSNAL